MSRDSALLDHAKNHARQAVAELKFPDDDILPVLIFHGPHGGNLMPLPFHDDDAKDFYAGAMTATLVVARATEAVFLSTVWMVLATRRAPR